MRAPARELARAFGALAALQPVAWSAEGLVCAPRAAPELARPALARCPLPVRALPAVPGWPEPPAAWVSGWYRRSPDHAPAPPGVPELVQAAGEGFGPGDHSTTRMCLAALRDLPDGPAVDVGCGSGLLAQAWAHAGRGPVLALDLDPAALAQCRRSLVAVGLAGRVALRQGPLERLAGAELAGRVVLANLPAPAHAALLARMHACAKRGGAGGGTAGARGVPGPGGAATGRAGAPRAALLSGLRPGEARPLVAAYRALGLRVRRAARQGRFECWTLVGPA